MLSQTGLLAWLLGRIKNRTSDQNRQYAAELLAILLQVGLGGTRGESMGRRRGLAEGFGLLWGLEEGTVVGKR